MKKLVLSMAALTLAATSASAADRMNPADLRRVQKAREHIAPAIAKEFGRAEELDERHGPYLSTTDALPSRSPTL